MTEIVKHERTFVKSAAEGRRIGKILSELRMAKELSQPAAGAVTGVNQWKISGMENGRAISYTALSAYAKGLGTTIDEVLAKARANAANGNGHAYRVGSPASRSRKTCFEAQGGITVTIGDERETNYFRVSGVDVCLSGPKGGKVTIKVDQE